MKQLVRKKLDLLIARYGFGEAELTPDAMLAYAIAAEKTCQDVGPFDPAFQHFKRQQLDFEAAAGYLEVLREAGRE